MRAEFEGGKPATEGAASLLTMTGIVKSFPGVKALRGVDFDLSRGEIHCLVGENGAGKSTLMRILAGAEQPDEGEITVDGVRHAALSPALGHRLGIGMIYQEADLVPQLSVAENVFLGHEVARRGLWLDRRAMRDELTAIFALLNLNFSPDVRVRDLGPAQRQLVQIAKALSRRIRILVLDEPTAALTDTEIRYLFELLESLKQRGIGMIYVSHRLDEILEIGDRVTVLRDGSLVSTKPVSTVTKEGLIADMVGRAVDVVSRSAASRADEVVLSVEGLGITGQFSDVSFQLHRGEVLGIAGLVGAGRSEVLECLFGITRPDAGRMVLRGRAVAVHSPIEAIVLGLGLVPEERRESGLVLDLSVAENITFPVLGRLSNGLMLSRRALARAAGALVARLGVKTPGLAQPVRTLSGGNQQKVVIGRWFAAETQILLLDEPTRGIDVGAKFEIYQLIRELVDRGMSVIMVSSDLPELLALSDRILVMCEGRVAGILDAAHASQVEIMRLAVSRQAAHHGGAT